MKALVYAVMALILFHVLAAVGFVGWLWMGGRLNGERFEQAVDLFSLTIEEQRQREAEAAKLAEQTRQRAEEARRLEQVADGPMTLQQRLAQEQEADEVAMLRLERLKRETDDLRRQNELFKQALADQQGELERQRETFDREVGQQQQQQQDENFKQTVTMYEQLKAKQAKQVFQEMMDAGRLNEVVEYLAAMQTRKAGAILREFKADDEVSRATRLLDGLRNRGVDVAAITG